MDKIKEELRNEFEGSAYPAEQHEENEIVIRLDRVKELLSVYYYKGFGDGRAEEWIRISKMLEENDEKVTKAINTGFNYAAKQQNKKISKLKKKYGGKECPFCGNSNGSKPSRNINN